MYLANIIIFALLNNLLGEFIDYLLLLIMMAWKLQENIDKLYNNYY